MAMLVEKSCLRVAACCEARPGGPRGVHTGLGVVASSSSSPRLEIAERRHCFESSEDATGNDAQNVRQGDVPGRIPLSRRRPNAFCGSEGAPRADSPGLKIAGSVSSPGHCSDLVVRCPPVRNHKASIMLSGKP